MGRLSWAVLLVFAKFVCLSSGQSQAGWSRGYGRNSRVTWLYLILVLQEQEEGKDQKLCCATWAEASHKESQGREQKAHTRGC